MLFGAAFAACVLAAGTMGFAIQRGGTCTVAAVDEWLHQGRTRRLAAMLEAAAWVGGGLLVARALGVLPALPLGHALTVAAVVGAMLLGLGAWLNGACVFGAIARLGNGEWAWAATPAGFYLGCLALRWAPGLHPSPADVPAPLGTLPMAAGLVVVVALAGTAALRLARAVGRHDGPLHALLTRRPWTPHAATTVIGLAFLVLLPLAGAWAWTDAVSDLARGRGAHLPTRLSLGAALFAGAVLGGRLAGRYRSRRPDLRALARCLAGGALMGAGSGLVPGSNDGLLLVGLPLLWPASWVAFGVMAASIAAASSVATRWRAWFAHATTT